jgi:hypothetical protein
MSSSPNPTSEPTPAPAGPGRAPRAIVTLVFLGLLAAPPIVHRLTAAADAGTGVDREAAVARYGFALEDVAHDLGIRFTHRAPVLDPKLEPVMPAVATMGAAVAVVDFDRDGWQDLYATTSAVGGANALFRNRGDGTFEDVAEAVGLADVNGEGTGVSMGTVWGDYDNDGYEDVLLYKWGRPELFHNEAGRRFTRVTERAGLPDWVNANTAVWFDYDDDGLLDLFLGAFYPEELDLWHLEHTRVMPESFEFAQNGGRNYLFHNLGGGRFEEVSERLGLTTRRWTLASAAADVDRDGDLDLFVANDYGINELYLNGSDGFREVGREATIARTPKSGMNAAFGDALNSGEWTLFVTNIAEPGVLMHGNDLWVPAGDLRHGVPDYGNMAGVAGVELGGWGFGAQFGDLNNDGWLDLFMTAGYISGERRESYWYDYSLVAGGHEDIIADTRNWPALSGRSLSGHQQDRVWLNDGAGRFVDVTRAVGADKEYDGRAVALADLFNRGALDVIVAYQNGPLTVYRATVAPDRDWVAFDLHGTRSNRSAIGAEVHLFWDGMEQLQQVDGGSGFAAQNQRRVHFGLGPGATVDSVVVRWPAGTTQTLRQPTLRAVHTLVEPE